MKFIYRLDSVGSPVFGSSETFEMELEDANAVRPDQTTVLDTLMTPLNTQLSDQTNLKPLDTEDLTSANAHYTLEDFFNSYSQNTQRDSYSQNTQRDSYSQNTQRDSYTQNTQRDSHTHGNIYGHGNYSNGNICRNESIDDVCEAGFDFSKLFTSDESPIENSFQSLIDLVRCEIPSNLSSIDPNFKPDPAPLDTINLSQLSDMEQTDSVPKVESHKTRKSKRKRSHFSKSLRPKTLNTNTVNSVNSVNNVNTVNTVNSVNGVKSPSTVGEVVHKKRREMVNSRRIDYGINDTVENIYDLEWHPGFTRHLGAKGRSALLELVRKVYRQDPEHYKAILQSRNSPSSISSLPFYSIPMLWELAHQFGIFKQALTVYKTHCFSKSKSKSHAFKNASSASTSVSGSGTGSGAGSITGSITGSVTGSLSGSGSASVSGSVGSDSESLDSEVQSTVKRAPMTTMSGRLIKRSKKMLESTDLDTAELGLKVEPSPVTVDPTNSSKLDHTNLTLKVDLLDNKTNDQDLVSSEMETPKRKLETPKRVLKTPKRELETPKRELESGARSNSWSPSPSNTLNCANTFNESPLTSSLKRIPV